MSGILHERLLSVERPASWPLNKRMQQSAGSEFRKHPSMPAPTPAEGRRCLYLEYRGQIYLLFLFAKSDQENLSDEQKKRIARWVDSIKKEKR